MGIFGDIVDIVIGGAIGGAAGAITVFTVEHGDEVLEGTIDVAGQIVRIGEDVYRAIPPEAFALAGDPIHGLLKHEAEDELILVGYLFGDAVIYAGLTWPILGPFGAAPQAYAAGRTLIGKLHSRTMNDQEWEMAEYIFRGTLPHRSDILLTNLAGLEGRPFTYPMAPFGTPVLVNLAGDYDPDNTIADGALLFHELMHVSQAKHAGLPQVFLYDAAGDLITEGDDAYFFEPGDDWGDFNLEQQASIVEGWTIGATRKLASLPKSQDHFDRGARRQFAMGSPLFRYINDNVRRPGAGGTTGDGRSVTNLLRDGGHRTVRQMHHQPPTPWWS